MKKSKIFAIALSFLSLTLLTGCFGPSEEETPEDTVTTTYESAEYKITAPTDWEVIKKEDFTTEVPKETQVVFRNNIKSEEFTANVNISKNVLTTEKSSMDYAKQIIANQKASLLNYREISREEIEVQIGENTEKTLVIAFEGKQKPEESPVRYIQLYAVKGTLGYIVTGAISPTELEGTIRKVDSIVRSFALQ